MKEMKATELIDALKCHVMRHGDCDVEIFIADKTAMPKGESRDSAAALYVVEHEDTDKHPRVILKGKIGY